MINQAPTSDDQQIEAPQEIMVQPALIFGGIVGAAQLAVLTGLLVHQFPHSPFERFSSMGASLIVISIGAFLGVCFALLLTKRKGVRSRLSKIPLSWLIASITGIPVAWIAPLAVSGGGPSRLSDNYIAFAIEYSIAWTLVFLFAKIDSV